MLVFYSGNKILLDEHLLFLAGPSPRSKEVLSWRPKAIEILGKTGYRDYVLNPEHLDYKDDIDYDGQIAWERASLGVADAIVFWVPRNLETFPGFTTNVEFGYYIARNPDKVFYGRPDDAPKNRYLDEMYVKETGRRPINSLPALLGTTVKYLYE